MSSGNEGKLYFLCFNKQKRSILLRSDGVLMNLTSVHPLRGYMCTLEGNKVAEGWAE